MILLKDIKNTLKVGLEQIQKIKNEDTPSLDLFDLFERIISDLSGRVTFLADVSSSKEIRDYGNEAQSIIENYLLEVTIDTELYDKFKSINSAGLDPESAKYLSELEKDFIDAGHQLPEDKKMRLIEIEKRLIDLEISFSKNIAEDKTEVLLEAAELDGLTQNELDNLKFKFGKYIVTMAFGGLNAVLENSSIGKKGLKELQFVIDNVTEYNTSKTELSEAWNSIILDFPEYRLKYRMAKNPKNVNDMYKNLIPKLQRSAEIEKKDLVIDDIDPVDITPWDIRYFITKKRNFISNIDNSEIKKYFYIHDVKKEMFSICEDVFEISEKFMKQYVLQILILPQMKMIKKLHIFI